MRPEPSLNRYIWICIYTSVVMGNGVESIQGAMINGLIYCQGFMINFWANSFHKMWNWQFTRMGWAMNLEFRYLCNIFNFCNPILVNWINFPDVYCCECQNYCCNINHLTQQWISHQNSGLLTSKYYYYYPT